MIQILSVAPDSATSLSLPGVPAAGNVSASFTAMMAEAIMLAKTGGGDLADAPLLPALPGSQGAAAPAPLAAATLQAGEGESGAANATLMALLSGAKVPLQAKPAAAAAEADAGDIKVKHKSVAAETDAAAPAVAVPDAGAALPVMPVQAVAPELPASPKVATDDVAPVVAAAAAPVNAAVPVLPAPPAVAVAAAPAPVSDAEPAAVAVEVDSQASGKKLPHAMAVIAAQQQLEPRKAGPDLAPVGPAQDADADTPMAAAGLTPAASNAPVIAPAAESAPVLASAPAPAVPATPVSGHEAAMLGIRHQAAAASPDRVVIGMQNGFGTAAWQQELGDKMVWMAGRQGQMAELVLNPPSLGAVEVRLNLSGGEASAQFFSANPNVRDVIEAALPRLREMMGSAGIALGEAMVSNQSFGQRERAEQQPGNGQGGAPVGAMAEDGMVVFERRGGTALLDYFA